MLLCSARKKCLGTGAAGVGFLVEVRAGRCLEEWVRFWELGMALGTDVMTQGTVAFGSAGGSENPSGEGFNSGSFPCSVLQGQM